jgi:hypothetical protein
MYYLISYLKKISISFYEKSPISSSNFIFLSYLILSVVFALAFAENYKRFAATAV